MSITLACPQCQASFEIADDLTGQPVRCHRCGHVCRSDDDRPHTEGIQSGMNPVSRGVSDGEPAFSPRRPAPRAPFPWGPTAVVTIGILFLLSSCSVGLNVWFLVRPDLRNRHLEIDMAMRAQEDALAQRIGAEKARELAMLQEREAIAQRERAERDLAELRAELARQDARVKEPAPPIVEKPKQVAAKDWGPLKGRVRLQGKAPMVASLVDRIKVHVDAKELLKSPPEDLLDPTWTVNPDNAGVANVVVFLRPAAPPRLAIPQEARKPRADVILDAPFAAIRPHVFALTPKLHDGVTNDDTGQKLVVRNSAPTNRCFKMGGVFNLVMVPGRQESFTLEPTLQPEVVDCFRHPWMKAWVWVFDHPYHAITDKNGDFEIPLGPRDVDLRLMIWHEALGFVDGKEGRPYRHLDKAAALDLFVTAK